MSVSYWIRENGNGAYCEGYIPDGAYDADCILVAQRPNLWSRWNNDTQSWCDEDSCKINYLRPVRDIELSRTDKFLISDYYATFSSEQQAQILSYRAELRNFSTDPPYDLPTCPVFMSI
jgi:hypothetical protein